MSEIEFQQRAEGLPATAENAFEQWMGDKLDDAIKGGQGVDDEVRRRFPDKTSKMIHTENPFSMDQRKSADSTIQAEVGKTLCEIESSLAAGQHS